MIWTRERIRCRALSGEPALLARLSAGRRPGLTDFRGTLATWIPLARPCSNRLYTSIPRSGRAFRRWGGREREGAREEGRERAGSLLSLVHTLPTPLPSIEVFLSSRSSFFPPQGFLTPERGFSPLVVSCTVSSYASRPLIISCYLRLSSYGLIAVDAILKWMLRAA